MAISSMSGMASSGAGADVVCWWNGVAVCGGMAGCMPALAKALFGRRLSCAVARFKVKSANGSPALVPGRVDKSVLVSGTVDVVRIVAHVLEWKPAAN